MTGIVYERRGGEEDSEGAIDYTFIHICLHFLAYTECLVCVCVLTYRLFTLLPSKLY